MREKHDSSFKWIWMALLSSFTCGLGNYIMGIKLIKAGPFGPGFTGAFGLLLLLGLRVGQLVRNKRTIGTFINYETTNLFEKEAPHRFRKRQIKALSGNFLPNILGLVFLNLSFKYASLCGLNQGILPTLTSLSSFYTSVLFYFQFSEMISLAQFVGMMLMIVCVVFLALEGMSASSKHVLQIPSPSGAAN